MRGRGGDQGDAHLSNVFDLFPVVVAAAEQRHLARVDVPQLEPAAQRAPIRPAGVARDVVQVRMGVDIEDAQPPIQPALLRQVGKAGGHNRPRDGHVEARLWLVQRRAGEFDHVFMKQIHQPVIHSRRIRTVR